MKTTEKYGPEIDAALSLWVKLVRAYMRFSKRASESIRSFNLTEPQFAALETLGHLGPMTIGSLCKKQLVSGGNMTLVVDNLEKEGYVVRVRSKEDRRTIFIELTQKGQDMFDSIFMEHARNITQAAQVLNPEEIAQLSHLLKKLGTSL